MLIILTGAMVNFVFSLGADSRKPHDCMFAFLFESLHLEVKFLLVSVETRFYVYVVVHLFGNGCKLQLASYLGWL